MAKDVVIGSVTDEAMVRIWEAIMEQVTKEYIILWRLYLKEGPDYVTKLPFSERKTTVKPGIIELEDYILGDLIAGPHADYIVKKLREEAKEGLNNPKGSKIRRKEIMKRG